MVSEDLRHLAEAVRLASRCPALTTPYFVAVLARQIEALAAQVAALEARPLPGPVGPLPANVIPLSPRGGTTGGAA